MGGGEQRAARRDIDQLLRQPGIEHDRAQHVAAEVERVACGAPERDRRDLDEPARDALAPLVIARRQLVAIPQPASARVAIGVEIGGAEYQRAALDAERVQAVAQRVDATGRELWNRLVGLSHGLVFTPEVRDVA